MQNPIKEQFLYSNTKVFPVSLNDKVAIIYHDSSAPEVDGVIYGKEMGTVVLNNWAYAVLTNDGDIVEFDNTNVKGVVLAWNWMPRQQMSKEQLESMPDIKQVV